MFKLFLILFFLAGSAIASEKVTASKIVQAIISVVDKESKPVWLESDSSKVSDVLEVSRFDRVQSCKYAGSLVLASEVRLEQECNDIPIIVLDYKLLNTYGNAVAAFFWKKGRPNIVFIKDRLEKFGIILPPTYKAYEEEQIW